MPHGQETPPQSSGDTCIGDSGLLASCAVCIDFLTPSHMCSLAAAVACGECRGRTMSSMHARAVLPANRADHKLQGLAQLAQA